MARDIKLVVYPTSDVAASKALFATFLGTEPYVDGPYYVGFKIGDLEVGLNPNAHKDGIATPIGYVDVEDIKASLKELLDAGTKTQQDIKDVGGGLLVASVKDPNGNILGLRQQQKV